MREIRRQSLLGAVSAVALTLLLCPGAAWGKPTVTLAPEFTSGALGGPGSVNATVRVEGTEYGGFPPPVIGVVMRLPAGTTVAAGDHATCSKQVLEQVGPSACPHGSAAGPVGEALAIVSFGSERVEESAYLESFFAPGGELLFFFDGHSPVSLEILGTANVAGNVITIELPLVSTVPGAPYASLKNFDFHLGETEAEEESSHLVSGVTLPGECPAASFSWSTAVDFDEGGSNPPEPEIVEAAVQTGCFERQEPLRSRRAQEARARQHTDEEAVAKKKAEEEAAINKRRQEEAELVALRALVKQLQEELHAAIRVGEVKLTRHGVLITIEVPEPGKVTVTGRGLKKTVETLPGGTHRLVLVLTKKGRAERRHHRRIKVAASDTVGARTVTTDVEVKL